jgi:hypothetical protein
MEIIYLVMLWLIAVVAENNGTHPVLFIIICFKLHENLISMMTCVWLWGYGVQISYGYVSRVFSLGDYCFMALCIWNDYLRICNVFTFFLTWNVKRILQLKGSAMANRSGAQRPNGTQGKICQLKLVLLGESAVGKSSLVLRFVKGQFHEYQESTIGGRQNLFALLNGWMMNPKYRLIGNLEP